MEKILEKNGTDILNIDGATFNNFVASGMDGIISGENSCRMSAYGNTISISYGTILVHGVRVKFTSNWSTYLSSAPVADKEYQVVVRIDYLDADFSCTIFAREVSNLIREDFISSNSGTWETEFGRFVHKTDGSISDVRRTIDVLSVGYGNSEINANNVSLIDLGTLTLVSASEFSGTISDENYAKLSEENAIIVATLPSNLGRCSGVISSFLSGYRSSFTFFPSSASVVTFAVTIDSNKTITAKMVEQKVIAPETGVTDPDNTDQWQSVKLDSSDGKLYTEREVPRPSSANAGKVPVVSDDGSGYELVDLTSMLTVYNGEYEDVDDTPVVTSFADADWSTIAQISESGKASTTFAVGDEKTIEMSTGEQVTLVILGFDHDDLADGSGKAGMTIGMKNLLETSYRMNATGTNAGGWDESEMRTSTMVTLLSQLPSDLQSVIKQVNKKATAGSQSESITTSADKLWLLAMSEIFSATSIENSSTSSIANYADTYNAEGTQYEYYENLIGDNNGGTGTNSLLIKKLSNGIGGGWWLRSPYVGNSEYFRYIHSNGTVNTGGAQYVHFVSFGFCV